MAFCFVKLGTSVEIISKIWGTLISQSTHNARGVKIDALIRLLEIKMVEMVCHYVNMFCTHPVCAANQVTVVMSTLPHSFICCPFNC